MARESQSASRVLPTDREDIDDRLRRNLARVDGLVMIYEQRAGVRPGRPTVGDGDLLRAAVVFVHASLEDVLRSVLEVRWPSATDPDLFRRLPFVLPSDDRRPEKLDVGELAHYLRGKSVDEVVGEAVRGHLQRSSFNNIEDIVLALRRAGIEIDFLQHHAGEIYALMQRRHWIVHRADRNERRGAGHHATRPIRIDNVRTWKAHVEQLSRAILAST